MEYLTEIDYTQPDFVEFYDELSLWSAPFGLLLLEYVPIQRGITILDVGAGSGFLAIELAQRCGPDSLVIAVDPWEAAMERLRRKLEYYEINNVDLMIADAALIDLADNSVDLIVSNLGINNFENASAVLANCYRVARPGRRLLLTTNLVGHMGEFYTAFKTTLQDLGMDEHLEALQVHIDHRGTVESVSALLIDAGFEVTNVYRDSFSMRFADGACLLRHHLIRIAFLPAWKSLVPAGMLEETFLALENRLNALAAAHGELSLTIPMACFEGIKE